MKKLAALCILAVLCLSLQSVAAVVIGDFENDMDGWVMENGATSAFSSPFGATLGTSSLEITFPATWKTIAKKSVSSLSSELAIAPKITMDMTVRNDGGQNPGWWMDVFLIINSDVTGWKELAKTGWGGLTWDPKTYNLEFTVTQAIRDAFVGGAAWAEVVLATNANAGGGKLWVDNIQIVPEPATLSMLGLGALALLKRRKA